jgi:hypothetical protein
MNGVKLGQDSMREKKINKKDEYNGRYSYISTRSGDVSRWK